VAKAIMEQVFLKFGAGEVLTDGGGEFRNELLSELCRLMGVAKCMTSPFESRTNSACERNHATINSMLAKCVSSSQRDWDSHLAHVAFCYNASMQESTQFSPFFLMHGTEPRWDVDFKVGAPKRGPYSVNDYADVLINRLEQAHELVRDQLQITASRMQDWFDRKVHVQKFNPGDEVYVLNLRLYQGRCPKWVLRYSDIATVVKKINSVTYEIVCQQ